MALFPRAKRDIFAEVRTARPRPKIFAEIQKNRARRGRVERFTAVPPTNAGECEGTPFGDLPPPAPGGAGKDGVDAERGPQNGSQHLETKIMHVRTRSLPHGPRKERWSGRPGRERSWSFKSAVHCELQTRSDSRYALATGEAAAYRLHVLNNVYGPGTRRLLRDAGLRRGMRVADLGCGVGMVTAVLAEIVGPEGEVVGVDFSAAQIAQARTQSKGAPNVKFVEASAADTGLPRESFDFVYSRFLLIHLTEPEQALSEMLALLKPNGILVCEDGDLTTAESEPESALQAFSDLWGRLGPVRGVDYTLGRRLYQMVLAAGFAAPEICFNQPAVAQGENKRLLELSVAEAGGAFVDAGLIGSEELDHTLADMRRANEDSAVLAVMPRMTQIWARKPAGPRIQCS